MRVPASADGLLMLEAARVPSSQWLPMSSTNGTCSWDSNSGLADASGDLYMRHRRQWHMVFKVWDPQRVPRLNTTH